MKEKIIAVLLTILTIFSMLSNYLKNERNLPVSSENLIKGATVTSSESGNINNLFDEKSSVWTTKKQGASIEIDFQKEILFNTVVIKESTDNVRNFSIFSYNGEDYELIYKQDRIDKYRLCAMENIKTNKIKIVFDSFDKIVSIEEIEVYYLADYERSNFKVTSYVTSDYNSDTGLTDIQRKASDPGYTEQFKVLTDAIIIGVVGLKPDGSLKYSAGFDNFKKDVEILKSINPEMTVRCTIMTNFLPGDFSDMQKALVKIARSHLDTLKANITQLVNETGIDGVDYDWESPQLPHEWNAYNKILIASKEALKDKILSVALWPEEMLLSKAACKCIDNVNIMAYDEFDKRGDHSSIYDMGLNAINHFKRLGFSNEQICLGIPFYGRTADKYAIWPLYDEDYGKWDNYRENFSYTDSNGNTKTSTVYLNGYAMVRDKTALALQADIGGIMIFHSGCDISYENDYSLHKAVKEILDQRIINN